MNIKQIVIAFGFVLAIYACSPADGNSPGHEFMPDMVHSTAYEANYSNYYYYNTWGTEEDYRKWAEPRKPVAGTIPRGQAGPEYTSEGINSISIPANGSVPYYYQDTEEERTRAMNEIIENPYPITAAGLAKGKELYDIFCAICHGEEADGNGYLARDAAEGGKYPAQPAILNSDEFIAASNGRYYHSIMYGKNVMGGYADKLSYEERWQVIHYIRSLQAKSKKLVYNEQENTLNAIEIPGEVWAAMHQSDEEEQMDDSTMEDHSDEEHHGGEDHHDNH